MKHMKKLVTLLLALIMALALVVPASAYTVDNRTDHAYKAYQIFSGTQSTESKPALGDVKWGNGIESAKFLTALKADTRFGTGDKNIFAACTTAADVAAIMAEVCQCCRPIPEESCCCYRRKENLRREFESRLLPVG